MFSSSIRYLLVNVLWTRYQIRCRSTVGRPGCAVAHQSIESFFVSTSPVLHMSNTLTHFGCSTFLWLERRMRVCISFHDRMHSWSINSDSNTSIMMLQWTVNFTYFRAESKLFTNDLFIFPFINKSFSVVFSEL